MAQNWIRVIAYCDWLACEYRGKLYERTARAIKKLAGVQQWRNYTLEHEYKGERFETTDRIKFLTAVEAAVRKPINEDASRLRYAKSPYRDDPDFNRLIPRRIKHWPDGLMGLQGDYFKLRLTVKPRIEDVPHNLMVTGQTRVSRSGVEQYLDDKRISLPQVDLWQGRYQ